MAKPPFEMGALEAAAAIERGDLTAEALARSCLDRIGAREDLVGAWEWLEPETVLAEARALDRMPRRGPLHGLPVAVKDIIDVAGMPTRMGSPIHAAAPPAAADAACVALMRSRGALALGKTVTTEFANFHPGRTRNPVAPGHTPGGSSSGSAAAVADHMAPLAVGTQTAGSVIRPAAFCGVVGYKPSFGLIPRAGIKPLADSLDTVGTLARDVPDAALLAAALSGHDALRTIGAASAAPRLGLCRTPAWNQASPEACQALDEARRRADRAGAKVTEVELDGEFQLLAEAQATLQAAETARSLAWERQTHPGLLSDRLRGQLEAGAAIALDRWTEAAALAERCRARLRDVMAGLDGLLAPSAIGAAPEGLSATGDPLFNRIWTVLHGPAVHLPVITTSAGLPVGVTVAGPHGRDRRILAVSHWLAGAITP